MIATAFDLMLNMPLEAWFGITIVGGGITLSLVAAAADDMGAWLERVWFQPEPSDRVRMSDPGDRDIDFALALRSIGGGHK